MTTDVAMNAEAGVAVQAFGPSELAGLWGEMGVKEHPILGLPSVGQVRGLLARGEEGRRELVEMLGRRQRRIGLAEEDPLNWGFEAETWGDADALLAGTFRPKSLGVGELGSLGVGNGTAQLLNSQTPQLEGGESYGCDILAIFGGNRAQKTYYGVQRAIQCAVTFPGTRMLLGSDGERSSIVNLQEPAWRLLKPHFGHLNGKRDVVYKINYTQSGGFTDGKVVLPNGSEVYFPTYGMDWDGFEGWEFGAPVEVYEEISKKLRAAGKFVPPNIGALLDENATLACVQMLGRRIKFRKAKVLWTFTPVKGITPAIKEVVGSSARTIVARPSELLPRKNVPDCAEGMMPYVRVCRFVGARAMAIYFFTIYNKWGPSRGRSYYDEVKGLCEGKSSGYVERVAYGFARDSVARAFPKFGSVNVVKRRELPAVGTNYLFIDPAGDRNWFMVWVRVAAGNPRCLYIYRDWPDARTHGEWAVATVREVNEENRRGWDGDAGPAQAGLGYGVTRYKEVILAAELVSGKGGAEGIANLQLAIGNSQLSIPSGTANEDPYRARLLKGARGGEVREVIAGRFIDPRAGRSEHQAEDGGTCIIDEFEKEQVDGAGRVIGPSMELTPASGVRLEEGLVMANELLEWNEEEAYCPVLNQPKLFVSEDCEQVRWMFENYTGRAGEKGASKDPADLVRYLALAELEHVGEGGGQGKRGRGF